MAEWLPLRASYLDEMLRHDGLGDGDTQACARCNSSDAIFKCINCLFDQLYCSACMVERHLDNPLHRICVSIMHASPEGLANVRSIGMAPSLKAIH